jgi:hypothetical protein
VEQLKSLLQQQHRDLEELSSEARKEINPARVIRLMRIVQRNVEISERIVSILERQGNAVETREEASRGFRTSLES